MSRLYKHHLLQTVQRLACQDPAVKTPTNNDKTCTSRLYKHHLQIMSRLARQDSPIKTRPSRLAYKTLKIMTRLLRQDSTNNDKTFMSRLYKHCQDSPVKTLETMKRIKHQDSTNIIYKYCPDLPVKTRPLKTCLSRL